MEPIVTCELGSALYLYETYHPKPQPVICVDTN